MPPELLVLSINSLRESVPKTTQINLINNGEEIAIEDAINPKKWVFGWPEQMEIWKISGNAEWHSTIDNPTENFDIYENGPNNCKIPETWNKAIDISKTDWLMISNDDVIWKNGWYDIFCKQVKKGCLLIGCGFSCFLVHKDLIEIIGKFQERLIHAYCEDTDYLLRILESRNIRISQEFRQYNYDCQLFGYFNHFKRDYPEINKKLLSYWRDHNIARPIQGGINYRIFEQIWGFGDKSSEVDKILSSYKFDWKYK